MVQSDLYIHGTSAELNAIKAMVQEIAQRIGCDIADESALNIPIGVVMQFLTGDPYAPGTTHRHEHRRPRVCGATHRNQRYHRNL